MLLFLYIPFGETDYRSNNPLAALILSPKLWSEESILEEFSQVYKTNKQSGVHE